MKNACQIVRNCDDCTHCFCLDGFIPCGVTGRVMEHLMSGRLSSYSCGNVFDVAECFSRHLSVWGSWVCRSESCSFWMKRARSGLRARWWRVPWTSVWALVAARSEQWMRFPPPVVTASPHWHWKSHGEWLLGCRWGLLRSWKTY